MGKRGLVALLNLSSWCLMMAELHFLAVPWGCLRFVIVVFPDHTHILFLEKNLPFDNLTNISSGFPIGSASNCVTQFTLIYLVCTIFFLDNDYRRTYGDSIGTIIPIFNILSISVFEDMNIRKVAQ